ncbi:hypothetical protein V8G54_028481 [Vigna mungo]|uniref:Uncharacterized protein n=1 Tax=Vigna mungo TaxID=3915 RepID=A0AAQ3MSR7_VIGMU
MSLKDQGNEFFKSGKYLKAAALYTQAIKQDPSNPTLYSNRAAALLQLDKLNKALDDAEMTIKLKPQWEKGYFRKGSILEAMKRYDDALAAFQIALQYNSQSQEVLRKIKRLNQLVKDSKRAQEVENMRSNVDVAKHLDTLKSEMESVGWRDCIKGRKVVGVCGKEFQTWVSKTITPLMKKDRDNKIILQKPGMTTQKWGTKWLLDAVQSHCHKSLQISVISGVAGKYGSECGKDLFSFLVETIETAVKSWHETSSVDARVYFLLDKEKTQTDKYAPVVNIDKAFESPHTHSNCFSFLRQYAEESFSKAACLVTPKSIIAYPQVWKGQGSRKWKHAHSDGFFVQFESPSLRKLFFIASSNEKGQTLCRFLSYYLLHTLIYVNIGIQRFWTLVFMKFFPGYTNKRCPDLSVLH